MKSSGIDPHRDALEDGAAIRDELTMKNKQPRKQKKMKRIKKK